MFGGEYKVEFITLMKQIYQSRDLQRIDELMNLMFDETKANVIVGTGFGELCITNEERRLIFWNDLKYWDDLLIDDETCTFMHIGNLELVSIKATSFSRLVNNTHEYRNYVKEVKDIAGNTKLTAYQRAMEIEWFLSCMLIPDGLEQQVEKKPIEINMILEDGKVRFMCFSYVKTLERVDSIYNWTDIRTRYNKFVSMEQFRSNENLVETLTKEGFKNVHVKMIGDHIFFGIALVDITKKLEQRLSECMEYIDKGSDLQTLFELRRDIAFTLMQYSDYDTPLAVIRFFGICDHSGIKKIKYYYPNY